jgi:hypothetical protein
MARTQQRYKREENFVFRQIENETILVPIKDNVGDMGSIYNLNPVGAFIWQQLDGEKLLQEIAAMITEEFDVSGKQAESDLNDFVDELKDIGAVKKVSDMRSHE